MDVQISAEDLVFRVLWGITETLKPYLGVQISAEDAQRALKDLIFSTWAAEGCESRTDTLKMVSLVDFFLPFLPLERRHVAQLFGMRLEDAARHLQVPWVLPKPCNICEIMVEFSAPITQCSSV